MIDGPISQINQQLPAAKGNEATLLAFSPRLISDQTLRPYRWNVGIDGTLAEHILHSNPNGMREAVGYSPQGQNDTVNRSILPDEYGIPMSMKDVSTKWTFLLILDTAIGSSNRRTMYSGYFDMEPMSMNSAGSSRPMINQQSKLIFTSSTSLRRVKSLHAQGSSAALHVMGAVDVIPPSGVYWQKAGQNSLYKTDPASILQCEMSTMGHGVHAWGDLDIAGGQNQHWKTANKTLRSPKAQLRNLVGAMESAYNLQTATSESQDPLTTWLSPSYMKQSANENNEETFGQEIDTIKGNLKSGEDTIFIRGELDCGIPLKMEQLVSRYPTINIVPFIINQTPSWDVRDQELPNRHNVISALVDNVVTAAAENVGIDQIAFRYNSWEHGGDPLGPPGQWEIQHVQMPIQVDQQTIKNAITRFQYILQNDLFLTIKYIAGDFDLFASHGSGQSMIKIHLMDYDNPGGVYETCGALGGIMTPSIGNNNVVEDNCKSLSTLLRQISMEYNAPGYQQFTDAFGEPANIDYQNMEFSNSIAFDGDDDINFNNKEPLTPGTRSKGAISAAARQLNI